MAKTKKTKKPKAKVKLEDWDKKAFIVQRLRGAFRKCPLYSAAKNRAKEVYYIPSKTGKPMKRVRYICAHCNGRFFDKEGAREIAVDHIESVISVDGFKDMNEYIDRLFCSLDNLQVLCNYKEKDDGTRSCHSIKTAQERTNAAEKRKRLKNVTDLQPNL